MQRWLLYLFSVLMLVLGQQASARADDYITSREFYEDKSNALTIQQVEQKDFTPYQDVLTGGFSEGTYWLKLRVRSDPQSLVLKIRPARTEELELFDPAESKHKPIIGAKYPWGAADIEALSYNFVLSPSAADRDVYLRVKSSRSYLVEAQAVPLEAYKRIDRKEQLLYGAYSAFTLMMAVWLLITWLMNRELVLGVFTIQQFMAVFHTLGHTGLARVLFDGHLEQTIVNNTFSLFVVIYPFTGFLANKLLLNEYGLKKPYRYIFNGLLLVSASVIVMHLAGDPLASRINNVAVLIAVAFFLISAVFGVNSANATLKSNALPIKLLRVFYAFNLMIWIVTLLPALGLTPWGGLALYGIYVYNLLSGLVFFFLLQYRAKSLLKLETEKASALKVEAEQERKQREEQSMLMAMLSHEIKTPLSILKLVMDEKVAGSDLEGHANRAVSNINFVVERCLQLGKLDAEAIQLNSKALDCHEFLTAQVAQLKAETRVQLSCSKDLDLRIDTELLRVVISNLLENALKYAPADLPVLLSASQTQRDGVNGVEISVSNEVGMMGAPDPDQVFKKYYRNTSATKVSGSGLGLFLVHELMGVLGGSVTYQLEDQCVRFVVWLPR